MNAFRSQDYQHIEAKNEKALTGDANTARWL